MFTLTFFCTNLFLHFSLFSYRFEKWWRGTKQTLQHAHHRFSQRTPARATLYPPILSPSLSASTWFSVYQQTVTSCGWVWKRWFRDSRPKSSSSMPHSLRSSSALLMFLSYSSISLIVLIASLAYTFLVCCC